MKESSESEVGFAAIAYKGVLSFILENSELYVL